MTLKTIRLELARTKDHPTGDPGHAYEFRAPLNEAGQIDSAAWPRQKELCVVRRFEKGIEVERGLLLHTRRGQWVFSYVPGEDDDEAVFRLSSHRFAVGEYVSVTEHDGVQRTFNVASVNDWRPAAAESVSAAKWPPS